jgi:hypothetical protein
MDDGIVASCRLSVASEDEEIRQLLSLVRAGHMDLLTTGNWQLATLLAATDNLFIHP